MTNTEVGSTPADLLRMLTGCWLSQAIHVVARLGIADLLRDGATHCTALAEATQTQPDALYRVLRALASVSIFAEDEDRRFRLTPLSEHLRTDAPGSLRAFAVMLGGQEHWRAWEGILHTVKTGQPAFEHVFGTPPFQYFEAHPDAARIFDEAMTSRSGLENAAIITAYDFAGARTIVDVGGGQGTLLTSILEAHPNAGGVVVDVPHVVARSSTGMERAGRSARCKFVAGDFFSAVPAGGDVYLLKRVIHDWDDESAQRILRNCRRAMSASGRLLLIEPIIPPGNEPSFNKLLDLLLLVWYAGGRERTEIEHEALLGSADFKVSRVIATNVGIGIIEALPVG